MDFDEYDYLEKAVENPEPEEGKETVNGGEQTVRSEDRYKDRRWSSKCKVDENGNDSNHRSKRTKSRDESRDLDRESGYLDRERGDHDSERASLRHQYHSSTRDEGRSERDKYTSSRERRDREKHNRKEDRNGKDKDRGIEREKDRERERRVRDHENDKERDKDSERERSHRSRTHSERQMDEPNIEKERDLDKSQDMELKEKEKEWEPREMERGKSSRRHKEKREDVAEAQVDPERDQRTVFAYQICLKADERDVYEFFSKAGKVRDVRLIMDRISRRSKGVGYIEFYDSMSVPMAIALSGQTLLGHPVMVKPSEAEKNLAHSTASVAGGAGGLTGPNSGEARRLYVGNLHFNIREDQLRQVFESFGTVELVQLPLDQETGQSKGYGFVQFARLEDARAAESLNGQLEIAGRAIKVSALTDQAGMQDIGANTGDFDDDEGGGLSLNARSRAILMQKLDRSPTSSSGLALPTASILGAAATGSSLVAPVHALAGLTVPAITVPSVDVIGAPSECLLLKNMFDPKLELEPDFDLDIKEDVQEECSKYGTLKHIFVDKDTAGFVYLQFGDTQAALGAQCALHGRWFAGKMITATFMLPHNYESKFPKSGQVI